MADAPATPNLIDRVVDRVDALQRRVPALAVVHGVVKKFGEDRGGQLAMLLAYKGFFSLFPLLLAFVTTLGLLLRDNDELRSDLIDSTLANVPVIGTEIVNGADAIEGSVVVLVGSILVSLWAGLGLLDMLQESLNSVWEVRLVDRPPWIQRRLRDVPGAVLIALCAVLSGAGRWILADGAGAALRWTAGARAARARRGVGLPGPALVAVRPQGPLHRAAARCRRSGHRLVGAAGARGLVRHPVRSQSSDTYGVFVIRRAMTTSEVL